MAVFISGASSGIGAACAHRFAECGHDLILVARRLDRLSELTQRLKSECQIRVDFFALDVRDSRAVETLIQDNKEVFNRVNILINNAGLAKDFTPLQGGLTDDWDVVIDTNVKGLLYVTRYLLPILIKNQGHIVNIGSVAGHWVYENGTVYCASKYAVRAINDGLRLDLNGTGVRVTEISPGTVETEFSEVRFQGDKKRAQSVYAGRKPLKPEDIADTVLWCTQRPSHINIQEVVIFPTEQAGVGIPYRISTP